MTLFGILAAFMRDYQLYIQTKSMLKMLLDPMGGIVLTNDGNAILREVSLQTLLLYRQAVLFPSKS